MLRPFRYARMPDIRFGPGTVSQLSGIVASRAASVLAVTGTAASSSPQWRQFAADLHRAGVSMDHLIHSGEPTPEFVDETAAGRRHAGIELVVGWGGGSVIDAAKAISAMLLRAEPVLDFLEDVGTRQLTDGRKVPYVAVPTTAGTGSEATKNAVLSRVGANGFKKSLRHDAFVPDLAVIDPELALSCPAPVTAACGMDALTQLLEGYVSLAASPMTDALALSGLEAVGPAIKRAVTDGAGDLDARTHMAYAALMSGAVLANAGLGIVHGMASPAGGLYPIPHGVACGTLIAAATEMNIATLTAQGEHGRAALAKYARAGELLRGAEPAPNMETGCQWLMDRLWALTRSLDMPRLRHYGIDEAGVERIVAGAANKNNPVPLEPAQMAAILLKRL